MQHDDVIQLAQRFMQLKNRRVERIGGLLQYGMLQTDATLNAVLDDFAQLYALIEQFDAIRAPESRNAGDRQLRNLQRAVREMERLWPPIDAIRARIVERMTVDTAAAL